MALTAEFVKVPVNDKIHGPKHLPGRITRIFANPGVIFSYAVRRRDSITNQFPGICNWLI